MAGFKNQEFIIVRYVEHDGEGEGHSANDPLPLADGNLNAPITADMVVTDASFEVSVALAGTTALNVGTAADADGYVANADITLGTPGVYSTASPALVSTRQAAGQLQLDVTGTSTAGSGIVVIRGYMA